MKQQQPAFKTSQLYDWDTEPKQERSTDTSFSSSTGFSAFDPPPVRRQKSNSLLKALSIAIVLGGAGLFGAVTLLHR